LDNKDWSIVTISLSVLLIVCLIFLAVASADRDTYKIELKHANARLLTIETGIYVLNNEQDLEALNRISGFLALTDSISKSVGG